MDGREPVLMREWVLVRGFPAYEISSDGMIRSIQTKRLLKPTRSSCPTRPSTHYLKVGLYRPFRGGKRYWRYIHRLVLLSFVGPALVEGHTDVCHLDGNSTNNSLENLAWGSRAENLRDAHCPERPAIREEEDLPYGGPSHGCPF
jgi:hypothetical protein